MSRKSYLSMQIKLITLSTSDLFTDEEYDLYLQIITLAQQIREDKEGSQELRALKKELQKQFDSLIDKHKGTPRQVNLNRILRTRDGRRCIMG